MIPAVLSGILMGIAHLQPACAWMGWAGVMWLCLRLDAGGRARLLLRDTALSLLLKYVVALHWLAGTFARYQQLDTLGAAGLFLGGMALMTALSMAPFALVVGTLNFWTRRGPADELSRRGGALSGSRGGSPAFWFPPAMLAGEYLLEQIADCALVQWLSSQWTVGPVLACLALAGWSITSLVCLYVAASLGVAFSRRRPPIAIPALVTLVGMLLLPHPSAHRERLQGIGAVHMSDIEHRPGRYPARLELLIWPEGTLRDRPTVSEGLEPAGVRLPVLPGDPVRGHLLGLVARGPEGPINALMLTDPGGQVQAVRAKSGLVPGYERRFLGFEGPGGSFVPGRAGPHLTVGRHRLIPLICYEVFNRSLVARGRTGGGEVLVVISSDLSLLGGYGLVQSIGALVMRSVEFRVPAVRASLWGSAALVDASGQVLELSRPGTSGVLAVSWKHGQPRLETGSSPLAESAPWRDLERPSPLTPLLR